MKNYVELLDSFADSRVHVDEMIRGVNPVQVLEVLLGADFAAVVTGTSRLNSG